MTKASKILTPREEAKKREKFDHDDCPRCGTPSVPAEAVTDQTLRGCPNPDCGIVWFENLDEAPKKGAWDEDHPGC